MDKITESTRAYERWLASRMPLIAADLKAKHERMAEGVFPFLRATFYRWAQLWPANCPELDSAPKVLGIGDIHVENFGTWRDLEGRLIWGVNDFDEAARLPFTNDLVRLAVSAAIAGTEKRLSCGADAACDAILDGYTDSLQKGGRPIVLAESHHWLRTLATSDLRDPTRYWEKLGALPIVKSLVPDEVKRALRQAMPEAGLPFRIAHRRAGLGSLGRRRFTALAEWRGGMIAREAKQLTTSAWHWAKSDGARTARNLLAGRLAGASLGP